MPVRVSAADRSRRARRRDALDAAAARRHDPARVRPTRYLGDPGPCRGRGGGVRRRDGRRSHATNNHVVLGPQTDLFTVAHEAAHVVQQTGGVQLAGGVGVEGDAHEQHADAVAHAVVAGQSAEPLLDKYAGRGATPRAAPRPAPAGAAGGAGTAVQRKPVADPKRSAPFYQDDKHPA